MNAKIKNEIGEISKSIQESIINQIKQINETRIDGLLGKIAESTNDDEEVNVDVSYKVKIDFIGNECQIVTDCGDIKLKALGKVSSTVFNFSLDQKDLFEDYDPSIEAIQ